MSNFLIHNHVPISLWRDRLLQETALLLDWGLSTPFRTSPFRLIATPALKAGLEILVPAHAAPINLINSTGVSSA